MRPSSTTTPRCTSTSRAGGVSGTVVMTAVGRGGDADSVQLDSGDLVVDAVTVDGRAAEFAAANHHLTVLLAASACRPASARC